MSAVARILAIFTVFLAVPATAQESWVVTEEWEVVEESTTASRYVSPLHARAEQNAIAAFGPFRVLDDNTAALVDITRAAAPRHFAAMMAAHPQIAVLEFVEAPGTYDDRANLRLGRMIRDAGLTTRVSEGGSVRSGAVELFIAGVSRDIAPEAEFAVHGWLDDWGRGAEDYPAGAPEHRRYLDYYAEMGMDLVQARAFYAMTNSVPFEEARWLSGDEMRDWLTDRPTGSGQPQEPPVTKPESMPSPLLAYLDLDLSLQ